MPAQSRGTLVTWKPDKAFGFIRPDQGGGDVFVHLRDFGELERPPRVGDVIRYQRVADGKGRHRAADVMVEGLQRSKSVPTAPHRHARPPRTTRSGKPGSAPWLVVTVFAILLVLLAAMTSLPVEVLPIYIVASLVSWIAYAFDKSAAMNGRRRTAENTLLLFGLLGGWPGALVAQGQFRHKTRKLAFLVPFWITVAVNCSVLAWACTATGASAIRDLFN